MPRQDRVEKTLEHLSAMAASEASESGIDELRGHLRKGKNHVAAGAAKVAAAVEGRGELQIAGAFRQEFESSG